MKVSDAIQHLIDDAKYLANNTNTPKNILQRKVSVINTLKTEIELLLDQNEQSIRDHSLLNDQLIMKQELIDKLLGMLLCLGFTMPKLSFFINSFSSEDWQNIHSTLLHNKQTPAAPYTLLGILSNYSLKNQLTHD